MKSRLKRLARRVAQQKDSGSRDETVVRGGFLLGEEVSQRLLHETAPEATHRCRRLPRYTV